MREADAYVFVTPEYNFGTPPALINALDYVYLEWNYKAAGFVSYGGLSGGTRSVQMTKQVLTTLKVVPIYEAVNIPFFNQFMKDGKFQGNESHQKAVNGHAGRAGEVDRAPWRRSAGCSRAASAGRDPPEEDR